ncbi:MAG TPA: RidA family protein [Planctomycetota bacterium]|nr:RidA family protein [Planctomycetota bacterium]
MPRVVSTASAPEAIGPYSQAIAHGGFVFCSGQIALDPGTGKLVEGSVAAQTERVLENLAAVLRAAGSGLDKVVRTTVYLVAMDDFAEMNRVYEAAFAGHKPARATVAVKELPRGAKVEIDCIAVA